VKKQSPGLVPKWAFRYQQFHIGKEIPRNWRCHKKRWIKYKKITLENEKNIVFAALAKPITTAQDIAGKINYIQPLK
jgi:hypothetical protein